MQILRFVCIFFILMFSNIGFSTEKLKITNVIDTNLFESDIGKPISLADVFTISIKQTDPLKNKFAQQVMKYARQNLIDVNFLYEPALQTDSVLYVYLWRKLPFGRASINRDYLREGFGYFSGNKNCPYYKEFEAAAMEAAFFQHGLYNQSQIMPKKPYLSNAIWISAGLGVGRWYIMHKKTIADLLMFDLAGHFRTNWLTFTGGNQLVYPWSCSYQRTFYLLAGRAFYRKFFDKIISVGININQYQYDTESERGTIKSDFFVGTHFELELLNHAPHVFGLGIKLTANWNQKYSYIILSLNPSFGSWAIGAKEID